MEYGLINMVTITFNILMACIMFYCDAVTFMEQLNHIAKRQRESRGIYPIQSRRRYDNQVSAILGAPSSPNHLPEAEPILPGHTLIRPARGMLKSSLKFPHMELDNGAGVYGNVNNLGIRYDGRNERVQYSGFRRMPENLIVAIPKLIEPQYTLSSFLELSDISKEFSDGSQKRLKLSKPKNIKGLIIEINPKTNNYPSRTHKKKRLKSQDTFIHVLPESYNEQMFKKLVTKKPKKNRFGPPGTTRQPKRPKAKPQASFIHVLPESYNEQMFKKPVTKKPKKKRFKPTGTNPRHPQLKFLVDCESMRRERKNGEEGNETPLFVPNGEDLSNDYYIDTESKEKKGDVPKKEKSKLEWFWKSKDAYNNIKINQDAPEHSDLMPDATKEKIRQWWFYHQNDFLPFEE